MNDVLVPDLTNAAFDIVVIGASLGGIQAVSSLLSRLPEDFPLPIVIVQHISPDRPSHLDEVLSYLGNTSVIQAKDGDSLSQGAVYIAPAGYHLEITPWHTFRLKEGARINYSIPSIDPLFNSVAEVYGSRAIGVMLTGANGDGANGMRAIHDSGGITIAQDRATSEAFDMPNASINTGCVNFVMPMQQIPRALIALAMVPGASDLFALPSTARYPLRS